MFVFHDKQGLQLPAPVEETLDTFNATIDNYMVFKEQPVGRPLQAVEVDPQFGMGHYLRRCLCPFGRIGPRNPRINRELLSPLACRNSILPREQSHIDALETNVPGEYSKAGSIWYYVLSEYPHHVITEKCTHDAYCLIGKSQQIKISIQGILPY